jgi:hypothetical protein
LQRDFLNAQGGLFNVIMQGGRSRAQLSVKIQEFARESVEEFLSQTSQQPIDDATFREGVQSATPSHSGTAAHAARSRFLPVVPPRKLAETN